MDKNLPYTHKHDSLSKLSGVIRRWKKSDEVLLIQLYDQNVNINKIADILDRTEKAIKNKAWRLKITKNPDFTEKEITYIKNNYNGFNLKEITKHLKRKHPENVCRIARQIGLTDKQRSGFLKGMVSHNKIKWDSEMIDFLIGNYKTMSFDKLSKNLGVSKNVVSAKLLELELWKLEEGETIWTQNKHPKGMAGKNHSNKSKKKMSKSQQLKWVGITKEQLLERTLKSRKTRIKNGTLNPLLNSSNPYSRTKSGKREDLNNTFFRSAWEANVARYFNLLGVKWEYEPKEFVFEGVKRGCISYRPDFYLPDEDRWVEVKGWFDKKSKTKLRRFKKYYPVEFNRLEIIDEDRYKAIAKNKKLVPGWE